MGKIKVKIEALGERPLTRIYDAEELKDKTVKNVVESMVREKWEGKDMTVSDGIDSEMRASGGYAVCTKIGGNLEPVRYEKVSLSDPIRKYEVDSSEGMGSIEIGLSGHHVVGQG